MNVDMCVLGGAGGKCFFLIIFYTVHSSSGLLALLMSYLKSYLTNAMIAWSHIT